jgi:hypothetical protein
VVVPHDPALKAEVRAFVASLGKLGELRDM